jgi:hypothetical protein
MYLDQYSEQGGLIGERSIQGCVSVRLVNDGELIKPLGPERVKIAFNADMIVICHTLRSYGMLTITTGIKGCCSW